MKLQTKLLMSFFSLVLLMGIIQSFFLQSRIENTFQTYLEQYNIGYLERMQQNLTLYYQQNGSWNHVQEQYFTNFTNNNWGHRNSMMMQGMSGNMPMAMSNADLLLLDTNGIVIADTSGTRIGMNGGNDLTGKAENIIINGEKKGTLILYTHELQNLEKGFVRSSNTAIVISSIIAAIVALLLSIFITKKITIPLKTLVQGTKQIANGEKLEEITIPSKDEFHELGAAFNEMVSRIEKNEEIRQTLVADVAHELRTPLSILQGKLESIQEGAIQPSEEVILELTDEVYRLKRLVSDLQQLSLAEAGTLPLNIQQVDIKQLITRVCHNLQWLADEKEISLVYEKIPECWLEIDEDRITQVVVNIIGNALRHTPKDGLVEIFGKVVDGNLALSISDNGPGISSEALPFIFDRFYKKDPSRSRNESGTGLGLSIAKGFVEAHGGTLTVDSSIGKGTIFTISLKCK